MHAISPRDTALGPAVIDPAPAVSVGAPAPTIRSADRQELFAALDRLARDDKRDADNGPRHPQSTSTTEHHRIVTHAVLAVP
jgi:hypothetical protein